MDVSDTAQPLKPTRDCLSAKATTFISALFTVAVGIGTAGHVSNTFGAQMRIPFGSLRESNLPAWMMLIGIPHLVLMGSLVYFAFSERRSRFLLKLGYVLVMMLTLMTSYYFINVSDNVFSRPFFGLVDSGLAWAIYATSAAVSTVALFALRNTRHDRPDPLTSQQEPGKLLGALSLTLGLPVLFLLAQFAFSTYALLQGREDQWLSRALCWIVFIVPGTMIFSVLCLRHLRGIYAGKGSSRRKLQTLMLVHGLVFLPVLCRQNWAIQERLGILEPSSIWVAMLVLYTVVAWLNQVIAPREPSNRVMADSSTSVGQR